MTEEERAAKKVARILLSWLDAGENGAYAEMADYFFTDDRPSPDLDALSADEIEALRRFVDEEEES